VRLERPFVSMMIPRSSHTLTCIGPECPTDLPLHISVQASAIGKHFINAKTFLEKRYNDDLELEDAVHTALLTLKEGFEGAMDHTNIEVGIIGPDKVFKVLTPGEIKDYLGEVE